MSNYGGIEDYKNIFFKSRCFVEEQHLMIRLLKESRVYICKYREYRDVYVQMY